MQTKLTKKTIQQTDLSRRKLIVSMGLTAVSMPLLGVVGCGGSSVSNNSNANDPSTGVIPELIKTTTWATGGTQSMTAEFPQDALFQKASMCHLAVTGALMEGPCYFKVAGNQADISEGLSGLPMQLCLQVIDENCQPLANAEVEVWHCDIAGVYSADSEKSTDNSRFAVDFCSGGNEQAKSAQWFRGSLITDKAGRVNFKSCLPGWYPGRCIHIHFRVKHQGRKTLVSQLAFSDALADEIYTQHPDYKHRGKQDTPVKTDDVFDGDFMPYLLDTKQNPDGSLLAYKAIKLTEI